MNAEGDEPTPLYQYKAVILPQGSQISQPKVGEDIVPEACLVDWSGVESLPIATDPLAAARRVRLGIEERTADPAGTGAVPLFAPLLDQGNLVVRSDPDHPDLAYVVRNVVTRALAGTRPGQLILQTFDPKLRGWLAPFTPLREVNDDLFPVPGWRARELQDLCDELVADVRRVADIGRGYATSLGALRREIGQPLEGYQVVVLLDYPWGLAKYSKDILASLLRAGPAHGISFLIHHDPALENAQDVMEQLDQYANTLTLPKKGNGTWSPAPGRPVVVDRPTQKQLQATITEIAAAARTAAASKIPFSAVQSTEQLWTDTSAQGISAAIGWAGHETVTLLIGDEQEQRHNLLVTGSVGSGKSNFLKVLIYSLAVRYSPDELELYLLDFKDGVSFFPLAPSETSPDWLPQAKVIGLESDREYGVAVLEHLFAEFDRRARIIKPYGDNIAVYRERTASYREQTGARMPRIVTIIDEFQVLFEEEDQTCRRAVQLLERLARRGRAYGIHLVLASQTITGIMPLIGKQDGIFSQFPIRIAFKNTISESQAVLAFNNTGAARLRYRGEAIVNLDFGHVEANRWIVVAAADDTQLNQIRQRCWTKGAPYIEPPAVFQGGRAATVSSIIPQLRQFRARSSTTAPIALVGLPIAVTQHSIGTRLSTTPNRHLAVIGAGQRNYSLDISPTNEPNLAVGTLQAAMFSLAMQHPRRNVEFTLLSYLTDLEFQETKMSALVDLLKRLGFSVHLAHHQDATTIIHDLADELNERRLGENNTTHYITAFAIDRAGPLDQPDHRNVAPVNKLRTILRDGPVRNMHMLGWWSSPGMFKSHLGYDKAVSIDTILALRLDQRDVLDLMGYHATIDTWSARDNRGLLFDSTQLSAPVTIVPFASLDQDSYAALKLTNWDA